MNAHLGEKVGSPSQFYAKGSRLEVAFLIALVDQKDDVIASLKTGSGAQEEKGTSFDGKLKK